MKKVLVANRGEIARRVIRSCRSLGMATVAVYSEADREALHVADADEAVDIGPAPAPDSYLKSEALIAAARATRADAVHPGYGFLAESSNFAERVTAAGLVWVGPSPATIRDMGDKQRARAIAEASCVPVVPGSELVDPDDRDALDAIAGQIGFPLMVKAAAGGGGIGMRRVEDPAKLFQAVASTRSMAGKAFGDGAVFLERFIRRARHVEIQVFGFGDGEAVHLFERDCSLQRRFQKILEESPAPGLPEEVVARMAESAVRLAQSTAYAGAGTVEFIVDPATFEFFFLEMNTRIQVEHPVTEQVTGTDLVAMQLELASGRLAAFNQSDIARAGHAIECRLYAENPAKMFMPSPGLLDTFQLPESVDGIRIETGYREGDMVSLHYDPMLAKIIAHGDDREEARRQAIEAMRSVAVEGIKTNRDFLIACLEAPEFASGDVHTGFVEANLSALVGAA